MSLHLQRAARRVSRTYDEALRPAGLTNGQFSLMTMLSRPDPPTIGALAAGLAMDRTTLTALLKPLDRRGLVRVTRGETDRRERRLELTAEGQRVLEQAYPLWRRVQEMTLAAAALDDPDALRRDLRTLSALP